MSLVTAVQTGLVFGVGLSMVLSILITVTLRINAEMWLHDYPPEVQQAYGPARRPETKRQKVVAAVAFFAVVIAALVGSVIRLNALGEPGFLALLVNILTMLMVFNAVDLLLLDWLWFETLRPRFAILPGMEIMQEKRYYRFHFIGFLKGTAGMLVAGPLLALIAWGALVITR